MGFNLTMTPQPMVRRVFEYLGLTSLLRNRYLIREMTIREVQSRYRGSALGVGWALLYPLLMLAAYTFVFRTVFKARWPDGQGTTAEFALQLFAGLLVFNLFAELMARAPQMILGHPNLVKKVIFPVDVLSWIAVLSGMFSFLMGFVILAIAAIWFGAASIWMLTVPLVIAVTLPVLLGIAWLLGAVGVFLKDIGHAMGAFTSMLLFVSPVLYPAKALPGYLETVLHLNPLTVPIESFRLVMLAGQQPNWVSLAVYLACGLVFAVLSKWVFERLRPAFADEM